MTDRPEPICKSEQGCHRVVACAPGCGDPCLGNPQLTAAIGYPVRCPHCDTTIPPTHWTKHLQRHHPEQAKAAVFAEIDAGYCPHCGRGDCAPTADEYEHLRQRAETAERRAALLADRISDARAALRQLPAGQQEPILRALRGDTTT